MAALASLLPVARSLSPAEKLELIQLLAEDLADAERPTPLPAAGRPPRIYSPRLASPDRAVDFVKQVREVAPDAPV